ncbi:predicted protein [Phaeodactylum tricornutum CCAP 1055/1]|jgi:hypothetical protein|uniref:Uncharacterized protein n=2 Tax=Phaeodactylum tricornutum TaxID=2850 RepID=B7FT88_PHATC|nr:predicted protein [Phaeodactylum tricornutum CCAP 1055/1]EEC50927.1 predicted protein [Phaeodactylum tricornutum CCAP 1055/1]|eukprot:XP_002178113.1 predicted protein [Phaeodactylum tricornutum CCAP 1055/1]
MRISSLAIFATLLVGNHAFAPASRLQSRTMTSLSLMSADETDKIVTQASDCAEGECSIDEVDDLIQILHAQQKELSNRLDEVRVMIKSLEVVNKDDDRKVDQVRETVRAIFRVFQASDKASGNDYPSLTKPMGYSGDVGKGSTTAYDALPPKKWKPASKP